MVNWGSFDDFFCKKVSQCRKKLKEDPLVSPGIVYYKEKKEKYFWFSFVGQQAHFGDTLAFRRTFSRTILVTSGVLKKTLTKSHDYSRLFSQKSAHEKVSYYRLIPLNRRMFPSLFVSSTHESQPHQTVSEATEKVLRTALPLQRLQREQRAATVPRAAPQSAEGRECGDVGAGSRGAGVQTVLSKR